MNLIHLAVIAVLAIWILSLPALALVRWLAGATRPRHVEHDDEIIFKRLNGLR